MAKPDLARLWEEHTTHEFATRSAEATLATTQLKADRYRELVKIKAVSQQEFVTAQAAHKQALADVAVAKAAVQTARINLDYASVSSPISEAVTTPLA